MLMFVEIRNTIYKLVFDKQEPRPRAWYLNILRTCKAIYEEAAPMAYATRTHVLHLINHGSYGSFSEADTYGVWGLRTRKFAWRMTRRQSSTVWQLQMKARKLRPHVAATIVSLQIHEMIFEEPPYGGKSFIKRMLPDVLNMAEQLDNLVNLRQFLWVMHKGFYKPHSREDVSLSLGGWANQNYICGISKNCASGVLQKTVRPLANILQKWPALEELVLLLPQLYIDVPMVMFLLTKHVPDDHPTRTRSTLPASQAPRITAGHDALSKSSQLRLRTNRTMANSDIVLEIRQHALRCIRPSLPEIAPAVSAVPTVPVVSAASTVPAVPVA